MLTVAMLLAVALAVPADPVRACDQRVRAHPRDLAAYRCYWEASRTGHQAQAQRALTALLERTPGNPRAQLYLALVRDDVGAAGSLELFEAAAAGFREEGEAEGEVYAQNGIVAEHCFYAHDCDRSAPALVRAEEIARTSGRRDLQALVAVWRARDAFARDDIGLAERAALEAERLLGPDGPAWVRSVALSQRGYFYLYARRYPEAFATYSALAALVAGNDFGRAMALGGAATAAVGQALAGDLPCGEAEARVREALALSEAVGVDQWGGALEMHMLLGRLLGPTPEGIAQLEQALAGRDRRAGWNAPYQNLWLLAKFIVDRNPADAAVALRHVDRALARARSRHTDWEIAFGLLLRSHVVWKAGDRSRAVIEGLAALDAFDRLRDHQPDPSVRARYTESTEVGYHLLAGRLLDPAWGTVGPEDVGLAFQVMERLRARVLHDSLVAAGGRRETLDPELSARGAEIRGRIARTQKRLLASTLGPDETARTLVELERAEAEEATWLDLAARNRPRLRTVDDAPPVTLETVQRALAEDEALLAFQTWREEPSVDAPYDDGSSWVLGITRDSVHAFRIPDARGLEAEVDLWEALIRRRDGSDRAGAARLYRQLLGPVLESLPPRVARLVLVPDGPLHRLPFDALRPAPDAPPLAERFALSEAPSATLWLHWHDAGAGRPDRPLLALADPAPPGSGSSVQRSAAEWLRGTPLGALPHARSEARAAVRSLAGDSVLVVGPEASERFLKTTPLRRYAMLHFATHAVVDTERPERSAVLLSPGAEEEDGLLQAREISALDLGPSVVVLAACSSSAGQVLRGEGMLSLGRSFFEGGAHAVVGNLWPVRDDESAALLDGFYRHLAEGEAVGTALSAAKRARIRAGAPAAAWAGMVLIGDGSLRPVPEAVAHARRMRSALLAAAAMLAGLGLAFGALHWRRLRRER